MIEYHSIYIHSSVSGYLGLFLMHSSLAFVTSTTINTRVHIFLQHTDFISFGYGPSRGITDHMVSSILTAFCSVFKPEILNSFCSLISTVQQSLYILLSFYSNCFLNFFPPLCFSYYSFSSGPSHLSSRANNSTPTALSNSHIFPLKFPFLLNAFLMIKVNSQDGSWVTLLYLLWDWRMLSALGSIRSAPCEEARHHSRVQSVDTCARTSQTCCFLAENLLPSHFPPSSLPCLFFTVTSLNIIRIPYNFPI